MTKTTKVTVSDRAVLQRLNRQMAVAKLTVKKAHRAYIAELGEYYVVNRQMNTVVMTDIDLVSFGRKQGALKPWEVLAQ
jgi:hypothetical protein